MRKLATQLSIPCVKKVRSNLEDGRKDRGRGRFGVLIVGGGEGKVVGKFGIDHLNLNPPPPSFIRTDRF